MVRKSGQLLLSVVAILCIATANSQAQSVLTRHVREAARASQAQPIGRLPVDQVMQLDVVLPLRDPAGLKAFLNDVSDPTSFSYRRFLTVAEFTERFGPSQADYDAVISFAKSSGFEVVGGTRDGMEVQIKGPVSAIEKTFHVNMMTYRHPTESRTFYGPDREPTTNLAFSLWHISGLDNFSIPHPMFEKKSDYAKAHGIPEDQVVKHATTGSGPSASFLGSDMRAAYYGGTALTGAGQNLGLFEYLGTDLTDLSTYFSNVGQTNNVPITLLSTDGTSTSCVDSRAGGSCDDTEQTLDMTQAIGMAPGLSSLVMYIGSTDTAIISAMTTHSPLPTTIGCSWGWTPADPSTLDPYFEKMAAQGQNFFAASGDSSTWSSSNEAWPADDAHVVSVGGTDLVTASAAGPWKSETAWVDSGGGISPDGIAIPSWQAAAGVINSSNKGSTTLRNGPDVSANANFTFYTCADQTACLANDYGGTSFATPMWAAYIALVNQQLANNGDSTIGFINPTIYAQNESGGALTSAYTTDFHDIVSGTSGSYSAVTGYDLVTGWGSPNGTGLINALAPTSQTPAYTLTASPTSVSVVVGNSGTSTITTAVSGGFDSAIALTASGQPTGVTVSFSPAPIAAPGSGTSTATLAVASTTTPGTYTITVSGTGGGITHTATIALTVTSAPVPAFTLAASPTSVSVAQGSTGKSTITTTVSGGFNSAVALSASGLPTGVTAAFSPSSIAAPGSGTSTLTLTVASTAATGTSTITITGTGGGITHTATVSLTVTAAVAGTYTISVSPTSGYLYRGQSGYAVVTITASGGFDSAVSLSATGIPSGVTGSFSPTSITGSGSSDFTLSVSRRAPLGTYPITITGTSGGTSHSTTLTFTVY
ncbi:MAG: protease pro-enzyme activation domain-containing protein [Terracidiphilus sp.]|jgi:kumamolisin